MERARAMGFVPKAPGEMDRVMDLDKKFKLRAKGFTRAAQFWAVIRMRRLDHHGISRSRLPDWVLALDIDAAIFDLYWHAEEDRHCDFAPDDFDRAAESLQKDMSQ